MTDVPMEPGAAEATGIEDVEQALDRAGAAVDDVDDQPDQPEEAIPTEPAEEDQLWEQLWSPAQPALPTLQRDQRALIDRSRVEDPVVAHDLRGGFPHRRAAICWYQRAITRTMGLVDDVLPIAALVDDHVHVHLIVTGPPRRNFAPRDHQDQRQPIDVEVGREYRQRLESRLLQACSKSYRYLSQMAGEYVERAAGDTDDGDLNPSEQESIAMRPKISELDRQQAAVLDRLWGGFESFDACLDWLHDVDQPTHGQFDVERPLDLWPDETLQRMFLDEAPSGQARRFRERFAVSELLPAFAQAVRTLDSGEHAAKRTSGLRTAQS